MKKIETKFEGVYILEPRVFKDDRGWFMESWSKEAMKGLGLFYAFVQDNISFSAKKGVLRGLHFQKGEYAQAKLVNCTRGSVLDVIVDLRKESATYKEWLGIELSEENKRQIIIPRGFAHGFLTLTDNVEFCYKVDNSYNSKSEGSILWNDPTLGIEWGIESPILSEKDSKAPLFEDTKYEY